MKLKAYNQTAVIKPAKQEDDSPIVAPDKLKGPTMSGVVLDCPDTKLIGKVVYFPEYVSLELPDKLVSVDLADIKTFDDENPDVA